MDRYVIIGNGVAGATAAEKIRRNDPDGEITIFSSEPDPFYYRPRLPDYIAGEVDLPQFVLHDLDWHNQKNIKLPANETVTKVDTTAQELTSDKGTKIEFDKLLLAAGARCFVPPVAGREKEGVFTLRTTADARQICAKAKTAAQAVIIGGGLLGLEAGYGLLKLGLKVSVVEFFDRLLPRQMDQEGAGHLQRFLEKKGFSFFLGARAKEILGHQSVEGLLLEDGAVAPGELILFSAGIRPDIELARQMELDIDKGVKVNDRLETSKKNIWAAGDLIEHHERVYGIWPAAQEQGQVAGANMSGGSEVYTGTTMSNSLKIVGVDLASTGDIDAEGKLDSAVFKDDLIYRKIVVENGVIKGFIFFGDTKGSKRCRKLLENKQDVSEFLDSMKGKDFDFDLIPDE